MNSAMSKAHLPISLSDFQSCQSTPDPDRIELLRSSECSTAAERIRTTCSDYQRRLEAAEIALRLMRAQDRSVR